MSRIEKLIKKFLSVPKALTWEEYVKVLNHFGYIELKTGKTGGSRRKFVNFNNDIIIVHKPHPQNIVKRYVMEQAIEKLELS